MKQKGFTLIELMICVAIIGILIAVALGGGQQPKEKCIGGKLFVVTTGYYKYGGQTATQVMGADGKPQLCEGSY